MKKPVLKKKVYTGKNIRISDSGFDRIKTYADKNRLRLGGFVEDCTIKEIERLEIRSQK